jgi:hypothetical protein
VAFHHSTPLNGNVKEATVGAFVKMVRDLWLAEKRLSLLPKCKYSVNPVIFGSRKAQSLRTLKGAATLKIQCDTAFTAHLLFRRRLFHSLQLEWFT